MSRRTHNAARIDRLYDLVLAGWTSAQIVKWVNEETDWGIGVRQIERLLAKAREKLDQAAEPHRQRELGKALARLDMLFAKNLQAEDYRACLAVEKERIALLKLGDKPRRGPAPLPAITLGVRGSWRAKQAASREAERN